MTEDKQNASTQRGPRNLIQSLDRGLILLDHVVSASGPVALAELAALLGVEKSSAHRLMSTLIARGYIVQDTQKNYLPGPGITELASKAGSRIAVQDLARPYLRELAEETGETAHFAILSRGQAAMIDCEASNHTLAVSSRVGQAEPIHCTALGKALVCAMDAEEIKELLSSSKMESFTERTICTANDFVTDCQETRRDFLARDDEEFRAGVRCLASPIFDLSGRVVAAIGISGPTTRLPDARYEEVGVIVRQAGLDISRRLGFGVEENL